MFCATRPEEAAMRQREDRHVETDEDGHGAKQRDDETEHCCGCVEVD